MVLLSKSHFGFTTSTDEGLVERRVPYEIRVINKIR